ncbi:MAG: hypothetical protein WA220_04900, partial [Candidatus Nitrosopolaris sp.]
SHLWITMSLFVFAFVTSVLALVALPIFQHVAFNVLPLSIQETKAIRHTTSSAPPPHGPSSNNGNTIPSSLLPILDHRLSRNQPFFLPVKAL